MNCFTVLTVRLYYWYAEKSISDEMWIICLCVCDFEYMWLTNRWNMNNVCVCVCVCVTLNICDWLIDEIWIMCVCVCVCVCDFEYMWLTNRWNMNNVCVCVCVCVTSIFYRPTSLLLVSNFCEISFLYYYFQIACLSILNIPFSTSYTTFKFVALQDSIVTTRWEYGDIKNNWNSFSN